MKKIMPGKVNIKKKEIKEQLQAVQKSRVGINLQMLV